jgi:hypothetical protein
LKDAFRSVEANPDTVSEDAQSEIRSYLRDFETTSPDYMKGNKLAVINPFKKYLHSGKFRLVFSRLAFVAREKPKTHPYALSNPLVFSYRQFRRNMLRLVRSSVLTRYYASPHASESYFLYPLHFHPEASTSLHAPYHVDEYATVRNIALSLPFDSWLYVKDHTVAAGYQTLEFYRALSMLPNVRLLAPTENTKELIKKARAVITLTSTVGFEAIVLKTPVYVLGDVFYDFHPLCTKIRSWNDLPQALRNGAPRDLPDSSVFNFLAAYWQCSFPGRLRYGPIAKGDRLMSALVRAIETGNAK